MLNHELKLNNVQRLNFSNDEQKKRNHPTMDLRDKPKNEFLSNLKPPSPFDLQLNTSLEIVEEFHQVRVVVTCNDDR